MDISLVEHLKDFHQLEDDEKEFDIVAAEKGGAEAGD